ncbi:MAG: hypothetical protein ACKOT0_06020 [bacterium]
MRRRGRAPVIVVGLAIALIAVGVPAPALALPPVTGPAIQAAVKAGASATLTAGAQWLKVACTLPGGLFTGGIAAFGPQEFTYRVTTQDPTVDLRFHATPQRLTSPIWFVRHVNQSNVSQVRAKAGVSSKVVYVSSPWTAGAEKFLQSYLPPSYGYLNVRTLLREEVLPPSMPDWLSDPAQMGSKVPLPDGGSVYSASHPTSATVTEVVEYTIDAMGRLVEWKSSDVESGVTTRSSTCTYSGIGVPGPLWKPSKSRIAPVAKIGRAAWQLHWTSFARSLAQDIRAAVAASQANTPASIRGFTYVVLDGKNLLPDWVITNIPGGAKYSLTDPDAGTACWSVTVKNGTLFDQACT